MFLRRLFGLTKSQVSTVEKTGAETSTFECLPNELIFFIFEYMYCHEIISAFINLNDRFQSLLSSYSSYHLSNSSQLTKSKFKLFQELPLSMEHMKSLTLSHRPDSFIDIRQFFSIYPIDLFYAKLKVLSFHLDRDLPASLILLFPNFQQLSHLSMLTIDKHVRFIQSVEKHIFHTIFFEIKALKYFKCDIRSISSSVDPEQISTIEYLELYRLTFDTLYWLCSQMPNLKSIAIENLQFSSNQYQSETFEQIKCLKLDFLNFIDNPQWIFEHLKHFTHLKRLQIQGNFLYKKQSVDGYQLANFIRQNIPHLKVFKFFFLIDQSEFVNINDWIESFQTDFWLIEKQWFVTCNYQEQTKMLYYYTEPSIQSNLEYTYPWIQMSTAIRINNSTIDELTLTGINNAFLPSFDQFNNVRSLTLFNISPNITYSQLNKCVNLSSIKRLEWQSETNVDLFFHIIEYCSADISIHTSSRFLLDIANQNKRKHIQYLKKIRSLNITDHRYSRYDKKAIRSWCSCIPNVEQLSLPQSFTELELGYIINSFDSLLLLSVICGRLTLSNEFTFISSLVGNNNKRIHKDNILYRWYGDELYIWFE